MLVYPPFNLWRALLSLDAYTQTVLYAFLIKGWSSSRIAPHLDVSVITIQELLENGRKQLNRRLAELVHSATAD
jgi:DNA-directed RNA polymerase specialized sigma24 family protein